MTKLGLLIAAAAGGAAVYWYIKRTCPCQHEADAAKVGAAIASSAPASAASAAQAFNPLTAGKDDLEDDGSAATLAAAGAGSFADYYSASTDPDSQTGLGSPSTLSSSAGSGCTSCTGSKAPAPSAPSIAPMFTDYASTAVAAPPPPALTDVVYGNRYAMVTGERIF